VTHRVAGTSISVMTKLFLALVLTTVAGSASDGQCGTKRSSDFADRHR